MEWIVSNIKAFNFSSKTCATGSFEPPDDGYMKTKYFIIYSGALLEDFRADPLKDYYTVELLDLYYFMTLGLLY